jgi:hypothetical protein
MGSGGGGAAVGKAFGMVARGMKEAFNSFGKFGFNKSLPSVKDIPLIIKALSVGDSEVAGEAHSALAWLTGVDLGHQPQAWLDWWRKNGPQLARRERLRKEVTDLFLEIKSDILTGRWECVHAQLSSDLRKKYSTAKLSGFLSKSAVGLRKVYRDARVAEIWDTATEAILNIDWGKLGFGFHEISLVLEEGQWRFARLPWGKTIRKQPRMIRTWKTEEKSRLPVKKAYSRKALDLPHVDYSTRAGQKRLKKNILKVLIWLLAFSGAYVLYRGMYFYADEINELGGMVFVIPVVIAVGIALAAFIHGSFCSKIKRSKEILAERRLRRPLAREAR